MSKRNGIKFSNSSPRNEKKLSTVAKELLISLCPEYALKRWSIEESKYYTWHGDSWRQGWHVRGCEAFDRLRHVLIEDSGLAPSDSHWYTAPRAEIIRHCRRLVKQGVTLYALF